MLQLNNSTPFEVAIMVLPDREGIDTLFTVVKGTFTLTDRPTFADEQVPVTLADAYHGEPGASSLRAASDVCLGKPGTDVLLAGSAWAPDGRPTWQIDVGVAVGPVSKTVRVFGDRVWDSGPAGTTVNWVTPFVQMPLVWERAYGGGDIVDGQPRAEPRNPVGQGFRTSSSSRSLAGLPLPNLEDPHALITSWKDTPPPACFAPLAPNWQPRLSYAGTYDDAWQSRRAPYLPTDFDPRFFQLAPAGLVTPSYLQGGEPVDVRGATPSGWLRFYLPVVKPTVAVALNSRDQERPVALDTVIIEPDAGRLVLVWRAAFPCDKAALKVAQVTTTLVTEG
jgi:hypothetical protein